ncbi:hypothetical protein [Acuticoccus kandeliae]|uniref:hypothetical protein n=1 Tax=Acuticoccus kandeliae TaxID=2073160 RepID=UPI000D3E7A1B|nr:hypothetical protein [Acuticoccus kandeliae]
MKQLLLATALIALPVAVFAAAETWVVPGAPPPSESASANPFGDLSPYETIVHDTQTLVDTGDLVAAEKRITDFETLWDDAEATMRPKSPSAWGNLDAAADDAFSALRAGKPDPAKVTDALAALSTTLASPAGRFAYPGEAQIVAGVAVTDANGHALPCEAMLADLRAALADGAIVPADTAKAADLQAKATERCNADDDKRADAFAAEALALAAQ